MPYIGACLFPILPAPWQISQDQWRKRQVANIRYCLHDWMEEVQISLYNFAAFLKAIMETLGEL